MKFCRVLCHLLVAVLFLSSTCVAADWTLVHPEGMNEKIKKQLAEVEKPKADALMEKLSSFAEESKEGVLEIRNGAVATTALSKEFTAEFDWSHSGSFEVQEKGREAPTPYMANMEVLLGHVELKKEWAHGSVGGPLLKVTLMPSGTVVIASVDKDGKEGETKVAKGPATKKGESLHVKIVAKNGDLNVTVSKKGEDPVVLKAPAYNFPEKPLLGIRSREPAGPTTSEDDGKKPFGAVIRNVKLTK